MASSRRYQYETSPRKLEPEYTPVKKKYPKKSTARKATNKKQPVPKKKEKNKKAQVVIYIIILFAVLFAISYRNSMIAEKFSEIKGMKTELASIEKENEQLKANIESSLNLNNIEKSATENFGMQKLDNSRTVYINLPRQDYVQPATEEVKKNENQNWFQQAIGWIEDKIK